MIDVNRRSAALFIGRTVGHYNKKRLGILEPPTHELTPGHTQQKTLHDAAHGLFMVVMCVYANSRLPMPDRTRDVLTSLKDAYEAGTWKQVWEALETCLVALKEDPVTQNQAVKQALGDVACSQLMYPKPQNH